MSANPEASEKPKPPKTRESLILSWWSRNLADRESGAARGLAARLRRATPLEALAEREVHDLSRALHLRDGEKLARLATLLAEVRTHTPQNLARRLGGSEPAMSPLRFQDLIRAEEEDLTDAMRRAVRMADRACNVAALGASILDWSDEKTRQKWWFHYYGAAAPGEEISEDGAPKDEAAGNGDEEIL